ncbi:MAG: VOC family protein [Chloroflexota bacterium]|nr:VOC family protein [Chloroflexota bacterium]
MELGYAFGWVDDVTGTVEFYEQAFGLKRHFIQQNGDLGLYAELETGETTLAIADTREARALFPDGFRANDPSQAPGAFQFTFVTPDVASAYEAALRAGATTYAEPRLQPWGQTIARVRDPNGVLVSIATPLGTP